MDFLKDLEHTLFYWINKAWANPFFDSLFPAITDWHKTDSFKYVFIPSLILFLLFYYRKKGALLILGLLTTTGVTDFICSQLLKNNIQRLRPPLDGLDVILRAPHFGTYSFPSNHAANIVALATFLSIFFPKLKWVFVIYAFLICLSRVYVGVHYVSDVLAGAIFGLLIGWLVAQLFGKLIKRYG